MCKIKHTVIERIPNYRFLNLTTLLAVFVCIFLILCPFFLFVYDTATYKAILVNLGLYQNEDLTPIVSSQLHGITGFLANKNQLDQTFFSDQAIMHMQDVQKLINQAKQIFNIVALCLAILSVWMFFKRSVTPLIYGYFFGSLTVLLLLIGVAIGSVVAFDVLFVQFHYLFFRNELWLFAPDDTLIQLFPTQFFVEFTKLWMISTATTSFLVCAASLLFLRRTRKNSNERIIEQSR